MEKAKFLRDFKKLKLLINIENSIFIAILLCEIYVKNLKKH